MGDKYEINLYFNEQIQPSPLLFYLNGDSC